MGDYIRQFRLIIFYKSCNSWNISLHELFRQYWGGQHQCDIYVGGNKVDIVTSMRYLGLTVTNDINDSLVKPVINDFNVKVNTILAYFNDVACDIKNTLFKQYCTRFYGSHLCTLSDREIEDLNIAWRKAQRRVWGLPYLTHCRLLPHVTDLLPGEVLFSKRFLKHFVTCYCNKNIMVNTVFRSSMCNVSRLDNNIWEVFFLKRLTSIVYIQYL